MKRLATRWQGFQRAAKRAVARRRSPAGIQVTTDSIGWIIAVVLMISVAVYFAAGAGTTWMNNNFHHVTSIQPTNTPGTEPVNG